MFNNEAKCYYTSLVISKFYKDNEKDEFPRYFLSTLIKEINNNPIFAMNHLPCYVGAPNCPNDIENKQKKHFLELFKEIRSQTPLIKLFN